MWSKVLNVEDIVGSSITEALYYFPATATLSAMRGLAVRLLYRSISISREGMSTSAPSKYALRISAAYWGKRIIIWFCVSRIRDISIIILDWIATHHTNRCQFNKTKYTNTKTYKTTNTLMMNPLFLLSLRCRSARFFRPSYTFSPVSSTCP